MHPLAIGSRPTPTFPVVLLALGIQESPGASVPQFILLSSDTSLLVPSAYPRGLGRYPCPILPAREGSTVLAGDAQPPDVWGVCGL